MRKKNKSSAQTVIRYMFCADRKNTEDTRDQRGKWRLRGRGYESRRLLHKRMIKAKSLQRHESRRALSLSLSPLFPFLFRTVLQPRGITASFLSRSAAFRVARIRLQRIEAAAGRRVRRDPTDRSVFPWKPTYLRRLDLYCLLPP